MSTLSPFFKSYTVISGAVIQLLSYFHAPTEFEEFANIRAEDTLARWRSYDGPDEY
jgi:hypothetical protein